jgi:hypothetical protein
LFAASNGGVTAAGIDDTIKDKERVALHLYAKSTSLNPAELVCGDIKSRIASTKLKEMQMFCEKVFAEYTEEK